MDDLKDGVEVRKKEHGEEWMLVWMIDAPEYDSKIMLPTKEEIALQAIKLLKEL